MSTPEEHSHLGPSGWDGFVRCAGKPNAEEGLPDNAGYEAAEGTVFHEMVSDCLELGLEPEDFAGKFMLQEGWRIEFNNEMMREAQDGLDFVRSFMDDPDVLVFIETRVDISDWTLPGQFGTADVVIVNVKERWIICFDWKYGKVPVYAEENYQAQGYVLGTWKTLVGELFEWDPSGIKVSVIIEQPRVPGAGGKWDTTMQRVLEFGQHVRKQAVLSTDPNAPRVAGVKQCTYCRANTTCGTFASWNLENINVELDDLDDGYITGEPPTLPENITPERRTYLLEVYPIFKKWFDKLHDSAYRDAQVGRNTPGMKLVDGRRPARTIKENAEHKYERALVSLLETGRFVDPKTKKPFDAYSAPKILTPAAAQDVVGETVYKKHLERFVDRGDPKPILVPTKDLRPALANAEDEFDVL